MAHFNFGKKRAHQREHRSSLEININSTAPREQKKANQHEKTLSLYKQGIRAFNELTKTEKEKVRRGEMIFAY